MARIPTYDSVVPLFFFQYTQEQVREGKNSEKSLFFFFSWHSQYTWTEDCSYDSNEVSGSSMDFNYILLSHVIKGPMIRTVNLVPEVYQRLTGLGTPEALGERRDPTNKTTRMMDPLLHQKRKRKKKIPDKRPKNMQKTPFIMFLWTLILRSFQLQVITDT